MLEHNFTVSDAFSDRQEARGRRDPYASRKSQSHFEADSTNVTWTYGIRPETMKTIYLLQQEPSRSSGTPKAFRIRARGQNLEKPN